MARKKRERSATGVYHVMLRGINKQDVFLDRNDFESMLKALAEAQCVRGADGKVVHKDNCTYYAYCILHNHLHVLVKEGLLSVSDVMKSVQDRFVAIYNRKNDRVGHLFQDRFASEPVDDDAYFWQLLRYIHRNPVKALEAVRPEDYAFSSWREYLSAGESCIIKGSDPLMMRICDVKSVIDRFGLEALVEWVNDPFAKEGEEQPLDMDSFRNVWREVDVWERLSELSGVDSVEIFKQMKPDVQVEHIARVVEEGASLRQASRLSSLSYRSLWNRLHPEEYAAELERKKEERKRKREAKKKMSEMADAN